MELTGIENLDKILGGGLPRPAALAVYGPMGSGKSFLIRNILSQKLQDKTFSCLFYAVDQPAEEVKEDLKKLGIDVKQHEEKGTLSFVDVFTLGVQKVGESYRDEQQSGTTVLRSGLQFSDLIDKGREFTLKNLKKKQLVILDSITPFFLMSDPREVFHYCQTMKYATRFANAIGIAINHSEVLDDKTENAFYGFADGLIELKKSSDITGGQIYGILKIDRMSKQDYLKGKFYYEIKDDQIDISMVGGIV